MLISKKKNEVLIEVNKNQRNEASDHAC